MNKPRHVCISESQNTILVFIQETECYSGRYFGVFLIGQAKWLAVAKHNTGVVRAISADGERIIHMILRHVSLLLNDKPYIC